MNMYRASLAGIAVAAIAIGTVTATSEVARADNPHVHILRACASDEGESAYPCAWFAPGMGNGSGHSFRIYRDGRVKQITDRRAFALLGDCDADGPLYC